MKTLTTLMLAGAVAGQVSNWGQCGGDGYTGETTCMSGHTCVYLNFWFSQCQLDSDSGSGTPTTSSTPTASAAPPSDGSIPFRWVGRVNPSTMELSWPGTGVAFNFTGTSASINVTSVSGTNSADLIVDGGSPIVISNVTSGLITTPSGLASGEHTVVLRKRSEPVYGSFYIGGVTTDGTGNAGAASTRQIEVIGDSISVGYGLDGTLGCTNSAALEDNPLTYEAVAADSLGADYNVIAWSGKGLTRNYVTTTPDTSPIMPELWTRYGANDADDSYTFPSTWAPQAVVINLGTNDFSYVAYDANGTQYNARDPINGTTLTNAMVQFVQTVQQHYPDAHYFLMGSPMLSDNWPTAADAQHTTEYNAYQAAATQLGAKVHLVDWPTQGSDVGCDYHPIASTHAAEGAVLASAIKSALGW